MRLQSAALIVCSLLPFTALAQGRPVTTLRTNVRLTTVDVVVTDKKGNPVHGLTKDDFNVVENKQPQTVRSFEEHIGATTVYDAPRPGVFTNATAARGGVSNVVLIDWLNTPASDQQFMRDQLVKFVLSQPRGTRTAIFGMGSSVVLLQDFTSDPEILKVALKRLGTKFSTLISQLSTGPDSGVMAMENVYESSGDSTIQATMAGLMQVANDRQARMDSVINRNKALNTMQGLREVAQYLNGVNGRKNVLWISSAFPTVIMRESDSTGNPFVGMEFLEPEFRATQNLLASSQIALYPVDPRGVAPLPSQLPTQDDYTTNLGVQRRVMASNSSNPRDQQQISDQFKEHTTMEELADATGGKAYFNTNDIGGALNQALNDGSHFYTLTYTPPIDAKPDQFRNIAVTVKGKGLYVSYRRGYFASPIINGNPMPLNSAKTSRAMQPMAPQSGEVLFQVEVSKPGDGSANTAKVVGGPVFDSLPHGTYQLDALVDFSTLQFSPDAEGKMHGVVDIATVIYDKNGKILDSRSDRANLALDDARYQAMLKSGMKYHQIIAVPDKGDGFVRMAVHDAMTDKLGTVQISMAKVRESAATKP